MTRLRGIVTRKGSRLLLGQPLGTGLLLSLMLKRFRLMNC